MGFTIKFDNGGSASRIEQSKFEPIQNAVKTEAAAPKATETKPQESFAGASSKIGELQQTSNARRAEVTTAKVGKIRENKTEAAINIGAQYVKAISKDKSAKGIETHNNTVPSVSFDKSDKRYLFPKAGTYNASSNLINELSANKFGPLDKPSMYLGANYRGQEIDAGLALTPAIALRKVDDKVYKVQTFTTDASGMSRENQLTLNRDTNTPGGHFILRHVEKGKETDVDFIADRAVVDPKDKSITFYGKDSAGKEGTRKLYGNFAFTPFYRTKGAGGVDKDGNRLDYADNLEKFTKGENAGNLQLFPGESFDMSVKETNAAKQTVELNITSKKAGTLSYSTSGIGNPKNDVTEFKRVDSVDQSFYDDADHKVKGNERKPFIGTSIVIENGKWGASQILGKDGRKPFTRDRFDRLISPEFNDNDNDFNQVSSKNGKGRITEPDGSENIYNNPSRFFKVK